MAATEATVDRFPVVCLGGSAGGLNAYQQILRRLPADTGMAFVIVSHRGMANALLFLPVLRAMTNMAVVEATDGIRLEPNRVFVALPHMETTTDGVVLNVQARSKPLGLPILITVFLLSLAKTCTSRSIAIILSGLGDDGSSALSAIKSEGGVTFAQSDAEWDAMPQEAIDTGHVDFILTAAEIGEHLATMRSAKQ
jgi:two-component system, chemotaxis family, CheB/CheR fusion protein